MADKDQNIEEFFRRFSDTYPSQISFNEKHWDQMEQMLDEQMPVSGSGRGGDLFTSGSTIATFLILLLGVSWSYWIQRSTETPMAMELEGSVVAVEAPVSSQVPDKVIEAKVEGGVPVAGAVDEKLVANEVQEDATVAAESAEASSAQLLKASVPLEQPSPASISSAEPEPTTSQAPVEEVDSQVAQNEELSALGEEGAERQELTTDETAGVAGEQAAVEGTELTDLTDGMQIIIEPDVQSVGISTDELLYPSVAVLPFAASDEPVDGAEPAFPRISIGFGFSPDLSSNQLGAYNRTGTELGAIFEYRFKKRLSLEVGAFSAQKKYVVSGEDYNPSYNFWQGVTDGEVPSSIDAACHVLDIPINLKYRFIDNPVTALSASAGLSSYLMLSEDYTYTLSSGYWDWGTGHENDHILGVFNLQVYYERKLGRNMAIEAAPFIKLPLTEFGHGNIKFHSLGMLFAVKRYFHWR